MVRTPRVDPVEQEIARAIRIMHAADDIVEIRAFGKRRGETYCGFFENHEKLVADAVRLAVTAGNGLFVAKPH